ncbi:hypothetical protein MANES_10G140200v8 [Manihot esculenta]|uniref:Uncharacterized protein n=1 Tax=Manihot esculenta TaxID=3983 RepID=A0ACB7H242_MANES|nr:hypothetical protein MANES_10G140200v8 [Manihot esculenta]
MKRLRSSDDLDSYNEKNSAKDSNPSRSSRSFYYKSDNVRKGLMSTSSSSSRYDRDRSMDDDNRESSRMVRKRTDHDIDSFDRRKGPGVGFDRYSGKDGYGGNGSGAGGGSNVHRSESFCGSRREFPKGFRSERDRSRREGSVSSWRRFGSVNKEFDEVRGSRGGNEERINVATRSSPKEDRTSAATWSSPKGLRDVRSSPTWSKDSGSEQSKSVEVGKKSELEAKSIEMEVKSVASGSKSIEMEAKSVSSGSSSEMEEGELEPEPESVHQVVKEDENDNEKGGREDVPSVDHREVEPEREANDQVNKVEKEPDKAGVSEGKGGKEVDDMQNCEKNSNDNSVNAYKIGNVDGDEGSEDTQSLKEPIKCKEDESREMVIENPLYLEEESRQEKGIDLEGKMEDVEVAELNKVVNEDTGGAEVDIGLIREGSGQHLKDKGKSVALSPTLATDSVEDGTWIERESLKVETCKDDDDMEGPSTRGFDLFSSSPARRAEKAEESGVNKPIEEKLVLEPLDLSLSLPNVLLPIGAAKDATQAPGSPSNGRSVQSFSTFRTNSDGFTASMSFSGSHSFFHNPSCSLTQNSLDMDNYEQSVHSRPIFQGVDQANWQGQAQNDSKLKDVPLYQRVLMNGNGSFHQSQALQGMSNGQTLQGNSKMANGLERQSSFHKQFSGGQLRNPDETRSPSHSVGSHDIGSNYSLEKKRAMREKHGGSLYRSNSQKEQEQLLIGGADFVETIISRIVSDPIHATARKFHEMTGQSASLVKESIREIMLNVDKQGQMYAFQSALQNRSDLTLDILLKSHRFQLEILVALKTGLREYLQVDTNVSSSDLAEVFLNLRCRNLACRSPLPVDECDCKVCAKKNGFCSACMCLICSKFDLAYQTCSWVGCDVCLHWCHADCALRESYIRNGRCATGAQGASEMQFHCVACDHPSEMFGFVKEVFQNFAKTWTAETFCKELEYVKRIFSASKDFRGRQLHELTMRMLEKLPNKANLSEVYSNIMGFLTESDFSKFGNSSVFSEKEQGNGSIGGIAGPSQDPSWLKPVYSEKAPKLERSASFLPSFHTELNDKRPVESELERSAQKEPIFDELESIVRIKQAEAKMFQARADDARREAEGLKRIALAKNEKIEDEYRSRITKLRLVEAEEMRKQKYEEFKALERAHQEYFGMKMRMEADIKDLLLKMEATKRNLAM